MAIPDKYDELWVIGDLVNYGPDPGEVVDFIRTKASVVVRGNHDQAIGFGDDPRCSPPFREMAEAMKRYTDSVLSDSQKQFLRELPLTAVREVAGVRVALCHAVPSNPLFTYCLPDSDLWEQEIESGLGHLARWPHPYPLCPEVRAARDCESGKPRTTEDGKSSSLLRRVGGRSR